MSLTKEATNNLKMRELVRPKCAGCHESNSPSAKPAAIAVFDLDIEDWSKGLFPNRIKGFHRRIKHQLTQEEIEALTKFLLRKQGKNEANN